MFNSHTVGGVGKDAAYVVEQLDARGERPGERPGEPRGGRVSLTSRLG